MGLTAPSLIFGAMGNNATGVRSFGHVRLSSQAVGCWGGAEENKQDYEFQKD